MDDKEFRKLRREDLIEIIYQYQRREQRMAQEIEMLRKQLEDRRIRVEKTGSIAEAALALSGVFEAAQKAADLYLQSIQEQSAQNEKPTQEKPAEQKAEKADAAAEKPVSKEAQQTADKARQPQKPSEKQPEKPESGEKKETPSAEPQKPAKQKPVQPQAPKAKLQKPSPQPEKPEKPGVKPEKAGDLPLKDLSFDGKPAAKISEDVKLEQPIPRAKPGKPSQKSSGGQPAAPGKQKAQAPAKQRPVPQQASASGGDTDEFIASLKEYLGM